MAVVCSVLKLRIACTDEQLLLEGWHTYDAAVHCASVAAGQRLAQGQQQQQQLLQVGAHPIRVREPDPVTPTPVVTTHPLLSARLASQTSVQSMGTQTSPWHDISELASSETSTSYNADTAAHIAPKFVAPVSAAAVGGRIKAGHDTSGPPRRRSCCQPFQRKRKAPEV